MTAPLCFDLETVPLASSLGISYPDDERTAPANFKDPVKIADWKERDREKWTSEIAKTAALNPRLGRIVCVGGASCDSDGHFVCLAQNEASERGLLESLWSEIANANGQIVTFNGLGFDVPYFLFRSMANGVKPTVPAKTIRDWNRRYSFGPHYDVRAVLTGWDSRATGKLTDWAESLGCNVPQTVSGKDIHTLYQAGDFDAIAGHCRDDVQTTKSLYDRVSSVYGPCGGAW